MCSRTFLPFFIRGWWLSLFKSKDLFIIFYGVFDDQRTVFRTLPAHNIRDFFELWREHLLSIPLIFVLPGTLRARICLHGLLGLLQDRVLNDIFTIAGDRLRRVTKCWLRMRWVLEDLLIVNDIPRRFLNIFLSFLIVTFSIWVTAILHTILQLFCVSVYWGTSLL